ncbi:MAG TPA: hypothetical protein VH442_10560, partial [Micromonosporaceae bacterium]
MKRMWRVAGALCIAHLVLLLAGYSLQKAPAWGASSANIVATYAGVSATKMYAGGFITTVAWLVLIAAITLISTLLRGTTETSGWYARLIVVAGSLAAAVALAGAFVTDGAAYYGATHGYARDAVAVASVASKFADQISFMATGMLVLAVAGAGLTSGLLPRWASIVSAIVGAIAVVSAASASMLNTGTL